MATVLDLNMEAGPDINFMKRCPVAVSSGTPMFRWTLPAGIVQRRFNIRISSIESGGLFILGEQVSSETLFQYPVGNPMTSMFLGLCEVEVAISSSSQAGAQFEYSSGIRYFVYDSVAESLYNRDRAILRWTNSTDNDAGQALSYHLMVNEEDPTFLEPSRVIFDGMVQQSQSGSITTTDVPVVTGRSYFWKVRAYDGLDYSAFSLTNGFNNTSNIPPEISIDTVFVTGNDYGDVHIDFTINDYDFANVLFAKFEYTGGNAGSVRTIMSLLNPAMALNNGSHRVTWRSGRNEKLVSASDYVIYAVPYDNVGSGQEAYHGPFSMDNERIGADPGGLGSPEIDFIVSGRMAKIEFHDVVPAPASAITAWLSSARHGYEDTDMPRVELNLSSWRGYSMGRISSGFGYDNGTEERLYMAHGIAGGAYTRTTMNLDAGDPLFTSGTSFFGSDGWHIGIDERAFSRIGARFGYVRFISNHFSDREQCQDCGGKGWRIQDLASNGDGTYSRTECPSCGGSRFGNVKTPMYEYCVSEYMPMEDWFSPMDITHLSAMGAEVPDMLRGYQFIYGSWARHETIWPKPKPQYENFPTTVLQRDATSLDNPRYGVKGVYAFMEGEVAMAKKYTHDYDPGPDRTKPVRGMIHPRVVTVRDEKGPLSLHIGAVASDYLTGFGPSDGDVFAWRKDPTHRGERGVWKIEGEVGGTSRLEPLGIIYLQSGWDSYNTIHWQSTMSSVTRIHLQVAKFFSDDSHTDYADVISENSEYVPSARVHLVAPSMWHAYWDTAKRQMLEDGYDYRLRIRQYDISTNTSSKWIYSSKFNINMHSTNPPNIISTEYEPWSKRLYVTFRIDDSQYDTYDVTKMWYSTDGNVFHVISNGDIGGQKHRLSSKADVNTHVVSWSTATYNLSPGDKYRIRMEVVPTRLKDGISSPALTFSKEFNPSAKVAELKIRDLCGQFQSYVYDMEAGSFEKVDPPIFMPGQIDRLKKEIETMEMTPPPSGKYAFYSGGTLVNPSGYQEWLGTELVPGITRDAILYNKAIELDGLINTELPYWQNRLHDAEMFVRKNLIDQGYYCNGFVDNNPANGIFRFRVENMGFGESVTNPDGSYKIAYDSEYEVYSRVQMDFFSSFDSQEGRPLRDFILDKHGERISGGDPTRTEVELPDGTNDLTRSPYVFRWDGVGDEPEKPWNTGTKAGEPLYNTGETRPSQEKKRVFVNFTIPKTSLPGEWSGHYVSNSYPSVSDTLPGGIGSFDVKYRWRVSSYNILSGTAREVPRHAVSGLNLSPQSNLRISYVMAADEELQTASLSAIYYCKNPSSFSWVEETELSFPTDRPSGHEANDLENTVIWTPYGKDRSRPCVCITESHQYMMWYSKPDSYGDNGILHSRGKNPYSHGEYSISVPERANMTLLEYSGDAAAYAPCVAKSSGLWHMWYTAMKAGQNRICHMSSADADSWGQRSDVSGLPSGCYSPCVVEVDGEYHMFYCRYSSTSAIYHAVSSDGVAFAEINSGFPVVSSLSNLNTPSVIFSGGEYVIFYTKDEGSKSICSRTSPDGISWSSERTEIAGAFNPWAVQDVQHGYPTLRIFYNRIVSGVPRPFTSWLSPAWTNILSGGSIGSVVSGGTTVMSSRYGAAHQLDIAISSQYIEQGLKNATLDDTLRIAMVFSNTASSRTYSRQSEWMDAMDDNDVDAVFEPSEFSYNSEMKYFDYGEDF